MTPREFSNLAGRLMRCPTAPYHEQAVRAETERICAEHGLSHARDPFGNLWVRLGNARHRPLVLVAHLDHPGFHIVRRLSGGRWLARFRGGVPDEYFRRGVPLRLIPGGTRARLAKRAKGDQQFELRTEREPRAAPKFAVWDTEDFAVRRGRIRGRACDDLIGVAGILGVLITLKRRGARASVLGVLTRAEEAGFHGALTVAAARRMPRDSLVVSLETSRELPSARMGQGVVVRVGDRASVFDPTATRFLMEVATELKSRSRKFQFQRALMSGGTCEATAFQELGLQAAAVCVALGNYHNCAPRKRIMAEYVSLADACGMVDLLVTAAQQMPRYAELVSRLPSRFRQRLREARKNLRRAG
jgi:putative aminopeptidase FrvX